MTLFKSAPKSLCVLRLSAIGDVCNTIAVIQSIQKQWPETEITWVTGKIEAQLLKSVSGINVVIFDKSQGWKAYIHLWTQLKGHKFDALLHMQYAIRASVATLGIQAKYKLGFDKLRSQDFQTLFTNVKVPSPDSMHVLDGLRAFATKLGIQDTLPHWELKYNESDLDWARSQLIADKRNLVVVPAASKDYKNWTVSGYTKIIEYASSNGWNVLLAGSPARNEIELADRLEKSLTMPVTNLVGKSSLLQLLALLDKTDLVIAPDTGPTHMANAMNTPVIGLYAHHNPERTGPYQFREYVVSVYAEAIQKETNHSLQELSWRSRVKNTEAMHHINANDVIDMFDKITHDFNLTNMKD
ncbi:glycosyl transferase [Vibrio inusitatus NBRC 102082]|uniref:Glycosyl transferase n=1 Tax=Vibrio inusitatus NBRC 102082 TaxID=1219070 RepID=A0A4Y3HW73_9VIBR|nr:glycosyltransferase family 9 protein [Vibrio inusitatus]GEA51307.1 glycosyl transferase [Vibrio inusitatus NBRC 102082]